MYYEYWKLQKPPFDNVPDPSMYVDCHLSLENAIAETLFAIEEGNECLSVIVGDVGLGKTLSLRIIIDSLPQDKYRIALITNPGISFIQLLREIIGQLTGKICTEKKKANLFELFNTIIFDVADKSKKVLIFIDEANAISPANLESLRLLTNMQDDRKNLFTIVLAGQMELARRLENPRRANLLQRIGTFNRIDRLPSTDSVRTYIETRLKLAGGSEEAIFTDDAISLLWEFSEKGVPRLINKFAKLCLKAGETNGFQQIDGEVVRQIGDRFHNLTGQVIPKRKPRKRIDVDVTSEKNDSEVSGTKAETETESIDERKSSGPATVPFAQIYALPSEKTDQICMPAEDHSEADQNDSGAYCGSAYEVFEIRGLEAKIEIPSDMLHKAKFMNQEQRIKSAGFLAAQVLRQYPGLTADPGSDPFVIWNDIRKIFVEVLEKKGETGINAVQTAAV